MVRMDKIWLVNDTYFIKILSPKEIYSVQDLWERCSDFSMLVEGRPPDKNAGHGVFFDLPPNKSIEDKLVFGAYNEESSLVAVMEIVKDYKEVGEWIIGLMMLDPKERGQGLGKKLHEFIKDYAGEHHADKLRLAVVEENQRAYGFWNKMGYKEIERVNKMYGLKEHVVMVMNLII